MARGKKKSSKRAAAQESQVAGSGGDDDAEETNGESSVFRPKPEDLKFFMDSLIRAGYAGEEFPEAADDQRKVAQKLRQFATRLCKQVSKFE